MYTSSRLLISPGAALAIVGEGVASVGIDWEQVDDAHSRLERFYPDSPTLQALGETMWDAEGMIQLGGIDIEYNSLPSGTFFQRASAVGQPDGEETIINIGETVTTKRRLGSTQVLEFPILSWRNPQSGAAVASGLLGLSGLWHPHMDPTSQDYLDARHAIATIQAELPNIILPVRGR